MSASRVSQNPQNSFTWMERSAFLLGRVIIIFSMVFAVMVFYTMTQRHFTVPKTATFQFLMLMLVACWGVVAAGHRFIRSSVATSAALFFMTAMVTCLVAVNMAEAWEEVTFLAACLILAVMTPKFFIRMRDFEVWVYILGILCILVDLFALALKFSWPLFFEIAGSFGITNLNTTKPVSFMGNENYTAEFLNMAIPICLMMIFCHRRKPAEFLFYTFVTLLNVITMYYIDCNASYMGFAFAIPVLILILIKYRFIPWSVRSGMFSLSRQAADRIFRHALIVSILLVCIGVTALTVVPNPLLDKLNEMATWVDTDDPPDHKPDGIPPIVFRLQCMDAAIRSIIDVPLLGIGPGNFKTVHPLYETQLERKVLGEETLARKVHNDHLEHANEFGLFGLFAWYLIVSVAVYGIFRSLVFLQHQEEAHWNYEDKGISSETRLLTPYAREFFYYLQVGLLGAIIVAMVSCAFGHTFVIPSSAVTFWLIVGVAAAVFQKLNRYERDVPLPVFGTTPEPLTPVQQFTRWIPDWARWIVLFLLILPVGGWNTYQWVGEAYQKYGMSALDQSVPNFNLMFGAFSKAKQVYPYQMEIYYILGRYYIDAVVAIDQAQNRGQAGIEDLVLRGIWNPNSNETLIELRQRLLDEGIITLQTDLYMNPNYKWAHNNLGVLYDRLHNFALSRSAYFRVLQIDREQIYAHYNLGLGYLMQGSYEKAINELERALVSDPGKTDIYRYLARAFVDSQDSDRGLTSANKFLSLSVADRLKAIAASRPVEGFQAILNQLEQGQIHDVMNKVQSTIGFEDDELQRIYLQASRDLILQVANRDEELKLSDNESRLNDPERVRKLAMARQAAELAEKVYPVSDPTMLYYMAEIFRAVNNPDKAQEYYVGYLRAQPADDQARRELTKIYVGKQLFGEALTSFQPVVQKNQNSWPDLITYARLILAVGQPWGQAQSIVERAIQLGGNEARQYVIDPNPGNYINQFIGRDPHLQELLGPEFLAKAGITPSATTPEPGAQDVTPVQPEVSVPASDTGAQNQIPDASAGLPTSVTP